MYIRALISFIINRTYWYMKEKRIYLATPELYDYLVLKLAASEVRRFSYENLAKEIKNISRYIVQSAFDAERLATKSTLLAIYKYAFPEADNDRFIKEEGIYYTIKNSQEEEHEIHNIVKPFLDKKLLSYVGEYYLYHQYFDDAMEEWIILENDFSLILETSSKLSAKVGVNEIEFRNGNVYRYSNFLTFFFEKQENSIETKTLQIQFQIGDYNNEGFECFTGSMSGLNMTSEYSANYLCVLVKKGLIGFERLSDNRIIDYFNTNKIKITPFPPINLRLNGLKGKRISKELFTRKYNYSGIPHFLNELHDLKEKSAYHQIALEFFELSALKLSSLINGNEYFVDDIVEANKIFMSSLREGSTFYGISLLINPQTWISEDNGRYYKEFNLLMAKKIKFERIFIFNGIEEFEKMKVIIKELASVSKIWWILKDEVDGWQHNPDISFSNNSNATLRVSISNPSTQIVQVSNSAEVKAALAKQFMKIKEIASKF